jgi:hypothetical protein
MLFLGVLVILMMLDIIELAEGTAPARHWVPAIGVVVLYGFACLTLRP